MRVSKRASPVRRQFPKKEFRQAAQLSVSKIFRASRSALIPSDIWARCWELVIRYLTHAVYSVIPPLTSTEESHGYRNIWSACKRPQTLSRFSRLQCVKTAWSRRECAKQRCVNDWLISIQVRSTGNEKVHGRSNEYTLPSRSSTFIARYKKWNRSRHRSSRKVNPPREIK